MLFLFSCTQELRQLVLQNVQMAYNTSYYETALLQCYLHTLFLNLNDDTVEQSHLTMLILPNKTHHDILDLEVQFPNDDCQILLGFLFFYKHHHNAKRWVFTVASNE